MKIVLRTLVFHFICIIIFAIYNIISPACSSSLMIEGFDTDDVSNLTETSNIIDENSMYTGNASNTNPFDFKYDSSKLPSFSSMFGNKCLLGCVSPTSWIDVDNKNCKENVNMLNSNILYKKCQWK